MTQMDRLLQAYNQLQEATQAVKHCIDEAEVQQPMEETLRVAEAKHGELLERLGDTVQPSTPPVHGEHLSPALDMPDRTEPEPPPIEVDMRVKQVSSGWWIWQCHLGDTWCEPGVAKDRLRQTIERNARLNAEHWLAALSEQLGVPLVAVWEDD